LNSTSNISEYRDTNTITLFSGESGVLNGTSNGGAEYSDVDTEEEEDQPAPVVTPKVQYR
jgi:hypothetical protein